MTPGRGYGAAMHGLLQRIKDGEDWRAEQQATSLKGKGRSAMARPCGLRRVGANFADDYDSVVIEAAKSAEVTHAHPEGISGAIAVAVGAACAANCRGDAVTRQAFIDMILPYVPDSEVKNGLKRAREINSTSVAHVTAMIGNGYKVTAQDTIPFTLWCVGEMLNDVNTYEDALWTTASGLGDIDTNCAIVGGIVSLYVGYEGIPDEWLQKREPLSQWAFDE